MVAVFGCHVLWDIHTYFHNIYAYAYSLYLFSFPISWLCLHSQSAMNSCGPSLYRWVCNIILCSLCEKFVTFFLNISTSGLWSAITLISQAKYWWIFSRP